MKVYIETYGCALNKADASLMKSLLVSAGHELVKSIGDADVVVINTCTVRKDTEDRVLRRLRNLKSVLYNKKLIITGCMVSTQPYTLKQVAPEASLLSPQNITKIVEVVENEGIVNYILGVRDTSVLPCNVEEAIATIPIAEGCLGDCSYCIVKLARRRLISYRPALIVDAVRKAVNDGAVEVELTAQDTASYGRDLGYINMPRLVRMIVDEVSGDYMIRIGMADPDTLTPILDEFIEVLREPNVFKYVHIPLQSGDDEVLKLMNRKYSVDDFVQLVKELRRKIPEVSIATDIIVGHPGEDDEAFENTVRVVNELAFDKIHIAQYTLRPRTKSCLLPQVSEAVKKLRSVELTKVAEEVCSKVNNAYVGSIAKTLITTKNKLRGSTLGRLINYKPVVVYDALSIQSKHIYVHIVNATFYDLRAKPIN